MTGQTVDERSDGYMNPASGWDASVDAFCMRFSGLGKKVF